MQIRLFTIPNLLTLSNLLCGALGAVAALSFDNLTWAFGLMAGSVVFDFFDGFVARWLGQSGRLGVELDSLADDISFGFLPAAVLFVLFGRMPGSAWLPGWTGLLLFVYAACAALRLAKFNIDDTQHSEFCGLPSPGAALFCASLGLLAEQQGLLLPREAVLAVGLVAGLLMISPVRMFSFKFAGFGWRGNELRYSFAGFSVVSLAALGWWAVPFIIVCYVAVSSVRWCFRRQSRNLPE